MLRLIVVDDDDDVRATVVGILEDLDGVTVVAQGRSGEQAARLVAKHRPDVVIIDLKMPVMGWAAIESVRRARPATRIIVLTAMPEADRHRALRAGADAVVRKSGRVDLRTELTEALGRVTRRADLT
jgi:two-component system, NarL family, invasion response regulator UvrY